MGALVRALGLHRQDVTPCGVPISVSAAHALSELGAGGPLSQRHLAERLGLEPSTVSRLVDQLERRGWVRRERDPASRRTVRLGLTSQGAHLAGQVQAARAAVFARAAAAIPEEEWPGVARALDLLIAAISTARAGRRTGAGDAGGGMDAAGEVGETGETGEASRVPGCGAAGMHGAGASGPCAGPSATTTEFAESGTT
ncbi:MAG: hypothetical protein AVDCRST_MAG77-640 [uncultured Chloroflexi bacterium]|uniref:HTH marR-type domain-containing protein n=1 Tax=uncultured Chloroflexota bacterium TaxID=166587 RepID=A0A6J4HH85_9CHLR|nr:MAG: hypothetical protein AVDCRST_MAG77-640 [uncultured Chloroflexota bacterium]